MTIASADPDEHEKAERLRAFFDGDTPDKPQRDRSVGISDEAYKQREAERHEAISAEFDELLNDDDEADEVDELVLGDPDGGCDDQPSDEAAEPTYERIDEAPILTPYDKARQRLTEAEIWRDVVELGSDEYHEAMAEVAAATQVLKKEVERATDDGWRQRRAVDDHRKTPEGREKRNEKRRKVRSKPNARRRDMTPEERAQHDADMNAKRVWVSKRRKAGWSAERIDAELPGWWARRLAKRACP